MSGVNKGCGKCRWYRDCDWGAGDCRHPTNLVKRYNHVSGHFKMTNNTTYRLNKDGTCPNWERNRWYDIWINGGAYAS